MHSYLPTFRKTFCILRRIPQTTCIIYVGIPLIIQGQPGMASPFKSFLFNEIPRLGEQSYILPYY